MTIDYKTTSSESPEKLWAVFSDVQGWPNWTPAIAAASFDRGDAWQPNSRLNLKLAQPSFELSANVKEANAPGMVSVKGDVMGVDFVQRFSFVPAAEGTQIMASVELSGAAVFFINNDMKQKGVDFFAKWLEALKQEAARRA